LYLTSTKPPRACTWSQATGSCSPVLAGQL